MRTPLVVCLSNCSLETDSSAGKPPLSDQKLLCICNILPTLSPLFASLHTRRPCSFSSNDNTVPSFLYDHHETHSLWSFTDCFTKFVDVPDQLTNQNSRLSRVGSICSPQQHPSSTADPQSNIKQFSQGGSCSKSHCEKLSVAAPRPNRLLGCLSLFVSAVLV